MRRWTRLPLLLLAGIAIANAQSASGSLDPDSENSSTADDVELQDPTRVTESPPTYATSVSSLRWTACIEGIGLECTKVSVPLCHAESCGSTAALELRVSRYEGGTSADSPTVWLLTDNYEDDDVHVQMRLIAAQGNANVYTLRSRLREIPSNYQWELAACKDLNSPRASVDASYLTSIEDCRTELTKEFGTNPAAAFSLDNAARDLHTLLNLFHKDTTTTKIYVYSSLETTRTVQRFVALDLSDRKYQVTGYIYENPLPMRLPADYDKLGSDAIDKFLDSCDRDELCKSKYDKLGTTMASVLDEIYSALDAGAPASLTKCVQTIKDLAYDSTRDLTASDGVRRLFAFMASYSTTSAQVLAPILYRTKRCSADDIEVLDSVARATKLKWQPSFTPDSILLRELMNKVITVSDLWPSTTPSKTDLANTMRGSRISDGELLLLLPAYCAFTGSNNGPCSDVYKPSAKPNSKVTLTYKPSTTVSGDVDTQSGMLGADVDVLILASRLRLKGEMEAAEQLYTAYTSVNSKRTSILVKSDNLVVSELNTSLPVLSAFLSGMASELRGKWHARDLLSVSTTPSKSTYDTAPVAVSFTTNDDKDYDWFLLYPLWEGDGFDFFDDDVCLGCFLGLGIGWWILIIVGVIVVGGLVIVFVIIGHQRQSERRRFQQEALERARHQEQADHAMAQELEFAYSQYQQPDQPSAPPTRQGYV